MSNERLRAAITSAGLNLQSFSEQVGSTRRPSSGGSPRTASRTAPTA
jgi:hypothetical protein